MSFSAPSQRDRESEVSRETRQVAEWSTSLGVNHIRLHLRAYKLITWCREGQEVTMDINELKRPGRTFWESVQYRASTSCLQLKCFHVSVNRHTKTGTRVSARHIQSTALGNIVFESRMLHWFLIESPSHIWAQPFYRRTAYISLSISLTGTLQYYSSTINII